MVLFMGYRPQTGSPKSGGRWHQRSPHEKKKAKGKKHRSSGKYLLEEAHAPTSEEVVEKTLGRLRSLGNQTFAVFPFSAYFDDWLVNLKDALIAFESSPNMGVDEQFLKERSQILANVERALEERRSGESSLEEAVKSLSDSRILLEQIGGEYAAGVRALEGRKNGEVTRLRGNVADLKGELDELARVKTGLFRAISKKAKAQKEAEVTQELNDAQSELELTMRNFNAEKESLRNEYEQKKQPVITQIRDCEKKNERMETDDSLQDRRFACEALVNAMNAFLQRKTFQL
jgi:chromosome segregation ATPase